MFLKPFHLTLEKSLSLSNKMEKYSIQCDLHRILFPHGLALANKSYIIKEEGIPFTDTEEGLMTEFGPLSAFLVYAMYKAAYPAFSISPEDLALLKSAAVMCNPLPRAYLSSNASKGSLIIDLPPFNSYKRLLSDIGAYHKRLNTYSVPLGRVYNVRHLLSGFQHPFLPPPKWDEESLELLSTPLSTRGDMEAFFNVPFQKLASIRYGYRLNIEEGFEALDIHSLADLVLRRPRNYKNYEEIVSVKNAPWREKCFFKGKVIRWEKSIKNRGTVFLVDEHGDEFTGMLWAGYSFWANKFPPGTICVIEGSKIGRNKVSISEIVPELTALSYPVLPIYKQSPKNGLSTKILMSAIEETLLRVKNPENFFSYLQNLGYSPFFDAVKILHFPKTREEYLSAVDTLAAYELFCIRLLFFLEKDKRMEEKKGLILQHKKNGFMEKAKAALDYKLTDDQENAISEIRKTTRKNEVENILLSANVGYGKTVVAELALLHAVDNGFQGALLAPTEILAKQLFTAFQKLIEPLEKKPRLLFYSGGMSASEKAEIEKKMISGEGDVVVGTHGVLTLNFKNLGFVVFDEEQKFGKELKNIFKEKRTDGKIPWMMAQTATPIPRSLALTLYGDTKLIVIKTPPPGRKMVKTTWIRENPEDFVGGATFGFIEVKALIENEIKNGKKVFFVCPAVEENEETNFISVNQAKKDLTKSLGLEPLSIHGKLIRSSQEKIMKKFSLEDKNSVLIGSSIIEVGIDEPKATVMVVLNADRFGAASLHQLRGRVGRDGSQGYCFLVTDKDEGAVKERLSVLVETNDGFKIAEVDLKTRKEGDIFGCRQHGKSAFRFCDLTNTEALLEQADYAAKRIYESENCMRALADARLFLGQDD